MTVYAHRAHKSLEQVACEFCGCVVAESLWDDHVNWHETLDMQATAVMRRSLHDIEVDLS